MNPGTISAPNNNLFSSVGNFLNSINPFNPMSSTGGGAVQLANSFNPSYSPNQEASVIPGTTYGPSASFAATPIKNVTSNNTGGQSNTSGSGVKTTNSPSAPSAPQNQQNSGGQTTTSSSGPNFDQMFNSAYQGAIDAWNQFRGTTQDTQNKELGDIDSQATAAQQQGQAGGQEAFNQLQGQVNQYGQQAQSAWDQAVQTYNQLAQGALNRFGGLNSAGQAVQGLLANSAQTGLNQLQNSNLNAAQSFAGEHQKITDFVTQNASAVTNWANQAKDQLNQQFAGIMAQINANQAATEGEKTNAKLQALQGVISQNAQIANQMNQQVMTLKAYAANQMSVMMSRYGQTPTPADMNTLLSGINQALSGINDYSNTGTGTTLIGNSNAMNLATNPAIAGSLGGKNQFPDTFNSLYGAGQGNG